MKHRKLISASAALLAIAALSGCTGQAFAAPANSTPVGAVEAYLDALVAGDFDRVYDLTLDPESAKELLGVDMSGIKHNRMNGNMVEVTDIAVDTAVHSDEARNRSDVYEYTYIMDGTYRTGSVAVSPSPDDDNLYLINEYFPYIVLTGLEEVGGASGEAFAVPGQYKGTKKILNADAIVTAECDVVIEVELPLAGNPAKSQVSEDCRSV